MTQPLDVLVPTYRRPTALAVTLAGLVGQTLPRFRVVVSDQSPDGESTAADEVMACVRLLRARGRPVQLLRHSRSGMAEQRQFLLGQATAPFALFLDDDVLCEPDVLARLLRVMQQQRCGFVGAPLPRDHCGEDVLAQMRLRARYGGCGVLPSGAYHLQLETTVPDRSVDAPYVLGGETVQLGARTR
jgi:GT2 family glycosyltransferase